MYTSWWLHIMIVLHWQFCIGNVYVWSQMEIYINYVHMHAYVYMYLHICTYILRRGIHKGLLFTKQKSIHYYFIKYTYTVCIQNFIYHKNCISTTYFISSCMATIYRELLQTFYYTCSSTDLHEPCLIFVSLLPQPYHEPHSLCRTRSLHKLMHVRNNEEYIYTCI